ncbi:MAG: IS21 family transposase [Deltaproteobacteria bacterium]|nr:IS21 family transposase [Deltaproteobacteria bacterium]
MAGKIKPMSQIKQLLRLYIQGNGKKSIARTLGISRNTVKSYLGKLPVIGMDLENLLALEDPELEKLFHRGNPAYKQDRFTHFKSQLDYFEKELKRHGVNRMVLWEEYKASFPLGYSYTQFCHHLNQQLIARKPSMVLSHNPGEKLFVDFAGKKLSYVDRQTGEIIWCPVFVACLPYSDYSFTLAVRSQSIEDFIHALRMCLEYLGGVPVILVPDNLKSAVIKANRYEPDINRALEDFCNYYNMGIMPARVVKPKDKALVENQVKMAYSRIYAKIRNMQFFDLHSLNEAIKKCNLRHNQTRMQQKPYCREECFLANEKQKLQPLPKDPYEIKYYKELKVAQNNHIRLSIDKHYYSVPYRWIGERVKVIYTRSMVRIYAKSDQIAIHQRNHTPYGYTTVKEHLCSHHQHYLKRSPAYYVERASKMSSELQQIVELLFQGGRFPEQNYNTCDGLFSLYRKTEPEIFSRACKEALECKTYSYRFLMKIIETMNKYPEQETTPAALPEHENIRGKEYYQQLNINF